MYIVFVFLILTTPLFRFNNGSHHKNKVDLLCDDTLYIDIYHLPMVIKTIESRSDNKKLIHRTFYCFCFENISFFNLFEICFDVVIIFVGYV